MIEELRIFTNKPGTTYDADRTSTIYAEDLNLIGADLIDLQEQLDPFLSGQGWHALGASCTYASADAPSFTMTVSGDLTSVLYLGNRIRLVQSATTKYFIVTKIVFSSGTTTITLYGGTDYTLANSAISSPYFSSERFPVGFPALPIKWSVFFSSTSIFSQFFPTTNTWYNATSFSVPIGEWIFSLLMPLNITSSASTGKAQGCLSTANNSASNSLFVLGVDYGASSGSNAYITNCMRLASYLSLSAKTTHYLNYRSINSSGLSVGMDGSLSPITFNLLSAYF